MAPRRRLGTPVDHAAHLVFLLAWLAEDDATVALVGAIQTTRTASRVYGADAERMRGAEAELANGLATSGTRRAGCRGSV